MPWNRTSLFVTEAVLVRDDAEVKVTYEVAGPIEDCDSFCQKYGLNKKQL